ncbi:MAG TPA: hypothetical protein VGN72_00480 [Tepidisphaeraceae bacterium]|jgi:hypothetical protein|nr:hypothetical protein [Tepidisphaeraceae bacterium]
MHLSTYPALSLLVGSLVIHGATAPLMAESAFDPAQHMRVDEVRPGMKGYGLSVFSGHKIERFELNVIAVQKNFNPKEDVILIRCLGERLEHSGVVAGMSGSPIFLTDENGVDRMVGALAYGWQLSKDPIAGVQPIEYMLELPTQPTTAPAASRAKTASGPLRWSVDEVIMLPGMQRAPVGYPLQSWNDFRPNTRLLPAVGQSRMAPMATPLMVGGASAGLLDQVAPLLSAYGLVPLQAGGAGTAATAPADGAAVKIERGSSLAVPLAVGDIDLTALGTCTEVLGERVYGFGHPFNNEGQVALPMASGYVTTIIPSLATSFKLGGMTAVVGTLSADQSVGIAGQLGPAPKMIPVDVQVKYADGSTDRAFHFDIAAHPRFTPILGTIVVSSSLSGQKLLPQYHTLEMDFDVQFENGQTVHVANTAVNSTPADLFFELGTPMIAASENPFQRVLVSKITGTLTVTPEARDAQLLNVNVPRTKYLPGETIKAYVTYRPFRGAESIMPIEMPIPADLPDGEYSLTVSDWQTYLDEERTNEPFRFTTENVDQVFTVLKELADVRRNALYVRLQRQADGVAVGRTAMPNLPSSRRQVFMDAGRSNTTAFVSSSVKVVPADYVFSGQAQFTIEVDRDARSDRATKPASDKGKSPAKASTMPSAGLEG